jgi:hypothetical protein
MAVLGMARDSCCIPMGMHPPTGATATRDRNHRLLLLVEHS